MAEACLFRLGLLGRVALVDGVMPYLPVQGFGLAYGQHKPVRVEGEKWDGRMGG